MRAVWVVLTMGERQRELTEALASIRAGSDAEIVLVVNGAPSTPVVEQERVRIVVSDENLGVPGGRDLGVRNARDADVVFFLDDDARLLDPGLEERVLARLAADPSLAAVSFRLVDESGGTARRHLPRIGRGRAQQTGDVVTFLGGACAIRRDAYLAAGGYWAALRYGHEELDLAWRLADHGGRILYDASAQVFHPASEISRHTDGWFLTGRNRVMIAHRELPPPIALVHVLSWLVIGSIRAPDNACRLRYLAGLVDGFRQPVARRPISYATVWRLSRTGRPPVI